MGRRLVCLVLALGLLCTLLGSVCAREGSTETVSGIRKESYAYEVLRLTNEARAQAGLAPLVMDEELTEIAMLRAAELSVQFGHTRPNGESCYDAFPLVDGENAARGQKDPEQVMDDWLDSESHRENVLKGDYQSVGIGCVQVNGKYCWIQTFSRSASTTPLTAPGEDREESWLISLEGDSETEEESQLQTASVSLFSDLPEGAWYTTWCQAAAELGLMNGVGEGKFDPGGTTSRAMLVQILYNRQGRPAVEGTVPFLDLDAGGWYLPAVRWAYLTGVTKGTSATTFCPNRPVTREQVAVFLYADAGSPAVTGDLSAFADGEQVSAWAQNALLWATQQGILQGTTGGGQHLLNPKATATRGEAAAMLVRYAETQ
jgi:hypothetical protein